MFQKRVLAVIVGGLFGFGSTAAVADAGGSFPKDNSRDYTAPVVVIADAGSPFPKDNSRDYAAPADGIHLAKPEAQGAFPKDNGIDRAIA